MGGVEDVPLLTGMMYRRMPVTGLEVETTARSGEYDIKGRVLLQDSSLDTPTVFLCELRIPDTTYRNYKTVSYYPGQCLATRCEPQEYYIR